MTGWVLLVVAVVAVAIVIGALLVTPADRRRGLAAILGVGMLVVGGSATAPPSVQLASQVGAGALFLLGCFVSTPATGHRRMETFTRVRPALVLLAVFGVVVLSTTQLVYPVGTVAFGKLIAVAVIAFLCVAGFGRRDLAFFLTGLVAIACVEAALGIAEFLITHEPLPWGFKVRADGSSSVLQNPLLPGAPVRVSGSLGHPIVFASLVGVALLIVLARRPSGSAATRTVLIALFAVMIVLSGSRSVMVGVALGAIVLLWSTQRGRPVRVFAVLSILFVSGVVFANELVAAVERLVGSGSYTNRANAFEAVPLLLGRAPLETLFGSGFGSDFELYYRGFFEQDGFMVIDNQLVTTLGTEGVVGFLLIVGVFIVAWARGSSLQRGLLALFGAMLFSFDYFGWFFMFALFAAVLALPRDDRTEGDALDLEAVGS